MDPFTIQSLVEEPESAAKSKALVLYSGSLQVLPKDTPNTRSQPRFKPIHPIQDPRKPEVVTGEYDTSTTGYLRTADSGVPDAGNCLPYLGNYCGPYYSAGSIQQSVVSDVAPCTDHDNVCKQHDECYASGNDHTLCDRMFVQDASADPLMASLIRMQISARDLYSNWSNTLNTMTNKRGKNSQGSNTNKPKQNKPKKAPKAQRDMQLVQAPSAVTVRNSNVPNRPVYRTSKTGVIISHSEMIMGVPVGTGSPTVYNVGKLVINPGKFSTFPWLATIATNYDKYIFRKLRFIYMPLVATSVSGRAGIAYDYDSSDATPNNRADFFSMTRHSEAAIWAPITLEVPLDNVERFTNTHTLTDSKLIDVGSIVYMTDASSATASSVVGDLLCEYEVELRRPQSPCYVTQELNMSSGGFSAFQDLSSYLYGPNVCTFTASGGVQLNISNLSPGRYQLSYYVYDSGSGSPVLTLAPVSPAVITGTQRVTSTATESMGLCCVDVKTGNGAININANMNFSACERVVVFISKIDSGAIGCA